MFREERCSRTWDESEGSGESCSPLNSGGSGFCLLSDIDTLVSLHLQWTTRTVLRRPDSADIWVPPFTRPHIQRSETWEPSHRPPRLHSGQPQKNEQEMLLQTWAQHWRLTPVLLCFQGDRLWFCQTSKRQDLDVVRNSGIPGARNHSQQSMEFLYTPLVDNWKLIQGIWKVMLKFFVVF